MITFSLLIIAAISGWIVRLDHITQIHEQKAQQ